MIARTKLAAMDNNYNVGRKQARVQQGLRAGEDRYRLVFPKAKKHWVVKAVYVEKDYSWRQDLIKNVLSFFCNDNNETVQIDSGLFAIPPNIASEQRPDKSEAIKNHVSRGIIN
jgi:hypothetical protein